ncbi:hypothetical protein ACIBO2_56730 [Nonomuraea sp. NPDC050022]
MPDTSGQAALRARIDELGLSQFVIVIAQGMVKGNTRNLGTNLVVCLQP